VPGKGDPIAKRQAAAEPTDGSDAEQERPRLHAAE
jgi:hypothetical protein